MKKVAVITGSGGGIGKATTEAFLAEGWYVVGIDMICESPILNNFRYMKADLANENESLAVFVEISKTEKRIDSLVNIAAKQLCKRILDTTTEEWNSIMACNLRSVFLATRHAHRALKESGGSIVNVSSVHALATSQGISAYAASKGGVSSFSRAAALEFASDGIRVNSVLPGAIDTQMLREGLTRGHLNSSSVNDALS